MERNYNLDLDGLIKLDKKIESLLQKRVLEQKEKISKNKDLSELSKKISKIS